MTERKNYYTQSQIAPNQIMANKQFQRTASVSRKPRIPPFVVTNLDEKAEEQLSRLSPNSQTRQYTQIGGYNKLTRRASISNTSYPLACDRRHIVNGRPPEPRGALARQLSLLTSARNETLPKYHQQNQAQRHQSYTNSPPGSVANLPLVNLPDKPEFAGDSRVCKLTQAMSIYPVYPIEQEATVPTKTQCCGNVRGCARHAKDKAATLNCQYLENSLISAESIQSATSVSVTPTEFEPITTSTRCQSKNSKDAASCMLSPFANLKNLFCTIQKTLTKSLKTKTRKTHAEHSRHSPTVMQDLNTLPQQCIQPLNKPFLENPSTISHLSIHEAKLPLACAALTPSLGELKSMSYIEKSIGYSYLKNSTKSNSERLNATTARGSGDSVPQLEQFAAQPMVPNACTNGLSASIFINRELTQQNCRTISSEWNNNSNKQMTAEDVDQDLRPPPSFKDSEERLEYIVSRSSESCESVSSRTSSCSVDPSSTSVGDNSGSTSQVLSLSSSHQMATRNNSSEIQWQTHNPYIICPQDSSLQIDVTNHYEKLKSTDSSTPDSGYRHVCTQTIEAGPVSPSGAINGLSPSSKASVGHATANDLDAETYSTTSPRVFNSLVSRETLYANKCIELERAVATLKSSLVCTCKRVEELQLGQLGSEYDMEQLQKQVRQLERENAHYGTIIRTKN